MCPPACLLPGGAAAGRLGLPVQEEKAGEMLSSLSLASQAEAAAVWKSQFPCGSRVRKRAMPPHALTASTVQVAHHASVQLCSFLRVRFNFAATLIRKV